jgi:hypothetical protein
MTDQDEGLYGRTVKDPYRRYFGMFSLLQSIISNKVNEFIAIIAIVAETKGMLLSLDSFQAA